MLSAKEEHPCQGILLSSSKDPRLNNTLGGSGARLESSDMS